MITKLIQTNQKKIGNNENKFATNIINRYMKFDKAVYDNAQMQLLENTNDVSNVEHNNINVIWNLLLQDAYYLLNKSLITKQYDYQQIIDNKLQELFRQIYYKVSKNKYQELYTIYNTINHGDEQQLDKIYKQLIHENKVVQNQFNIINEELENKLEKINIPTNQVIATNTVNNKRYTNRNITLVKTENTLNNSTKDEIHNHSIRMNQETEYEDIHRSIVDGNEQTTINNVVQSFMNHLIRLTSRQDQNQDIVKVEKEALSLSISTLNSNEQDVFVKYLVNKGIVKKEVEQQDDTLKGVDDHLSILENNVIEITEEFTEIYDKMKNNYYIEEDAQIRRGSKQDININSDVNSSEDLDKKNTIIELSHVKSFSENVFKRISVLLEHQHQIHGAVDQLNRQAILDTVMTGATTDTEGFYKYLVHEELILKNEDSHDYKEALINYISSTNEDNIIKITEFMTDIFDTAMTKNNLSQYDQTGKNQLNNQYSQNNQTDKNQVNNKQSQNDQTEKNQVNTKQVNHNQSNNNRVNNKKSNNKEPDSNQENSNQPNNNQTDNNQIGINQADNKQSDNIQAGNNQSDIKTDLKSGIIQEHYESAVNNPSDVFTAEKIKGNQFINNKIYENEEKSVMTFASDIYQKITKSITTAHKDINMYEKRKILIDILADANSVQTDQIFNYLSSENLIYRNSDAFSERENLIGSLEKADDTTINRIINRLAYEYHKRTENTSDLKDEIVNQIKQDKLISQENIERSVNRTKSQEVQKMNKEVDKNKISVNQGSNDNNTYLDGKKQNHSNLKRQYRTIGESIINEVIKRNRLNRIVRLSDTKQFKFFDFNQENLFTNYRIKMTSEQLLEQYQIQNQIYLKRNILSDFIESQPKEVTNQILDIVVKNNKIMSNKAIVEDLNNLVSEEHIIEKKKTLKQIIQMFSKENITDLTEIISQEIPRFKTILEYNMDTRQKSVIIHEAEKIKNNIYRTQEINRDLHFKKIKTEEENKQVENTIQKYVQMTESSQVYLENENSKTNEMVITQSKVIEELEKKISSQEKNIKELASKNQDVNVNYKIIKQDVIKYLEDELRIERMRRGLD